MTESTNIPPVVDPSPVAGPSTITEAPREGAPFSALPLAPAVLANLQQLGYERMTAVQAASLPRALAGKDLIVQARTGSGKTAAFALPALASLDPRSFVVQALVLCPTRELAEQVTQEMRRLARSQDNIKILTLCGGTTLRPQAASLAHGAHIVIGTPGRILDHLGRETLSLASLRTLVLDEADRMLDMGFADEIAAVIERCPPQRQTLLFSATYPPGVTKLARRFMRQPEEIRLTGQHAATKIRQRFYEVDEDRRLQAVGLLLDHYRPERTLAFCNTKLRCSELVERLQAGGIVALALHGDLEQLDRDQVLVRFANRSCSVLVATDVAARGLDIAGLEAVINVDVTFDVEVHTHRVGRTGRVDATGWAFTLASRNEMERVARIDRMQGSDSAWHGLDELTPSADPEPLRPPMVTLQLLGGRKDKIRPGDVLGALTKDLGFSAEQVGKISINEFSTYVAVDRGIAREALRGLSGGKVKGKTVKVRRL